jgi:hypothetical protein
LSKSSLDATIQPGLSTIPLKKDAEIQPWSKIADCTTSVPADLELAPSGKTMIQPSTATADLLAIPRSYPAATLDTEIQPGPSFIPLMQGNEIQPLSEIADSPSALADLDSASFLKKRFSLQLKHWTLQLFHA